MKLHTTSSSSFSRLPGILGSGAILSRLGYNVAHTPGGGFNHKSRHDRTTPVDQDCVRKFFKGVDHPRVRRWHNHGLPSFFRSHRAFDKHGIFVLDQTHLVVPDNPHCTDVARMPVDEHGQRIDVSNMTPEQKKSVRYRPCYALSELLHVVNEETRYVVVGYQLDPGDTDELPQARRLVKDFVEAVGPGVMKLSIVDRGYIDGRFIPNVKTEHHVDVMVPLKLSMDMFKDAVRLAESGLTQAGAGKVYKKYEHHGTLFTEEVRGIDHPGIRQECSVPLHVSLMRILCPDAPTRYWAIATTYTPSSPAEVFDTYAKRTCIEERHKQFKCTRNIGAFCSTNRSLVETHVLFTLLTYSLVQLCLSGSHLSELADKTIQSLRQEERLGKDNVVVYGKHNFAVFDLDKYTSIVARLHADARRRLCAWLERFRHNGKMRTPQEKYGSARLTCLHSRHGWSPPHPHPLPPDAGVRNTGPALAFSQPPGMAPDATPGEPGQTSCFLRASESQAGTSRHIDSWNNGMVQ